MGSEASRETWAVPDMRANVVDRAYARFCRAVTPVASVVVAFVAASAAAAWVIESKGLLEPALTARVGVMMPNTAFGLFFAAASLWLVGPRRPARRNIAWIGGAFATLTLLIGAVTIAESWSGRDLGVDRILKPFISLTDPPPGRPPISSATNLAILGLALLILRAESPRAIRTAHLLAVAAVTWGLVAVVGYAFGLRQLYAPEGMLLGAPPMHPMSLTTAISVVLLGLGTMFARREHTLVGIFERPDLGGYLARRLFPAVLLIPLIIGSLNLLGTRAGVYSAEFGAAIPVVAMAVSLAVLTLGSAAALGRVDRERLRAIDRLQRSESLFRTIFDNTTIGMALVDERGRPIVTNPALQRMLGYSANEIARIPFGKFTHPDDVRVDVALFKEVLGRKRESYEIEKRYLRKDGSVLWGRLNAAAARDDSGRLLFLVGLVQDISERKKAEEGWRRLTAILEATPDVVGMTDEAGRVQYLNRAGRELTGLAESDLPRLSIADFHPQESAARILAEALPIALREGVWRGETALQGANGRLIPVSQVILAHRGSDGSVDFVSTVMRDITERKEEEENQKFLLEVSRAFSALLESDAVLHGITTLLVPRIADFCIVDVVKADGRIERSALKHADPDRQALLDRLAGSAPVAGRGVGVAQTVASAESRLIGEVVPAWIAADSTSEEDARVIAELAPRSAMIVPLVAGGRVLGVITCASTSPDRRYAPKDLGLVENVAARAALALEAARLFRESQEATRVRDEVLRVVAHDLRNPLHTISLTADLLRERLGPAVQTDEGNRLDVIRRSVDQAKHLIEDLLDVARMEAGRLTIDPTPLDPAALVREAADLHSSQAAERSLRLDTDFAEASGPVLADRARILQVFANLIGNAIRFSPEGGQVTVRAKRENGGIRFSISDQGPGITEESMPHLFDPFWQAATTGTGGAGLGLAIARGIVEAHGGRIWAESVPGSGSTFHFTVPAAPASSAAADAAA